MRAACLGLLSQEVEVGEGEVEVAQAFQLFFWIRQAPYSGLSDCCSTPLQASQ